VDFVHYINTPAETIKSSPLVTTIKLTRGKLSAGWVFFPRGPAGTLHLIAEYHSVQIIPWNTGQDLRLDDCVAPLHLGIQLDEPPFDVQVYTWNDSTEYAHALTVCLSLEPLGKRPWNLSQIANEFAGTNGYAKP
jgi:hypothetical protein